MLPIPGAPLLALSPGGALLAVCAGPALRLYSTAQLLEGGAGPPLRQHQLPAPATQLQWRPAAAAADGAAADPLELALVTQAGAALLSARGAVPAPFGAAPPDTRCLAWSPDGAALAFGHGDAVTFHTPATGAAASVRVVSQDSRPQEGQSMAVDGLQFLGDGALLVSATLLEGEATLCTIGVSEAQMM